MKHAPRDHIFHSGNIKHRTFITNHSNQLSYNGAVSSWSGQPSLNETERTSEQFMTREESVNTEKMKGVNSREISS